MSYEESLVEPWCPPESSDCGRNVLWGVIDALGMSLPIVVVLAVYPIIGGTRRKMGETGAGAHWSQLVHIVYMYDKKMERMLAIGVHGTHAH